jgi:hypothetical protein
MDSTADNRLEGSPSIEVSRPAQASATGCRLKWLHAHLARDPCKAPVIMDSKTSAPGVRVVMPQRRNRVVEHQRRIELDHHGGGRICDIATVCNCYRGPETDRNH